MMDNILFFLIIILTSAWLISYFILAERISKLNLKIKKLQIDKWGKNDN